VGNVASANCFSNFVAFENFKDEIACSTMQKNVLRKLAVIALCSKSNLDQSFPHTPSKSCGSAACTPRISVRLCHHLNDSEC